MTFVSAGGQIEIDVSGKWLSARRIGVDEVGLHDGAPGWRQGITIGLRLPSFAGNDELDDLQAISLRRVTWNGMPLSECRPRLRGYGSGQVTVGLNKEDRHVFGDRRQHRADRSNHRQVGVWKVEVIHM